MDAALGISSSQDAFWRGVAQQVKSVKDDVVLGDKASTDLYPIAQQALQAAGYVSLALQERVFVGSSKIFIQSVCVGFSSRQRLSRSFTAISNALFK